MYLYFYFFIKWCIQTTRLNMKLGTCYPCYAIFSGFQSLFIIIRELFACLCAVLCKDRCTQNYSMSQQGTNIYKIMYLRGYFWIFWFHFLNLIFYAIFRGNFTPLVKKKILFQYLKHLYIFEYLYGSPVNFILFSTAIFE